MLLKTKDVNEQPKTFVFIQEQSFLLVVYLALQPME